MLYKMQTKIKDSKLRVVQQKPSFGDLLVQQNGPKKTHSVCGEFEQRDFGSERAAAGRKYSSQEDADIPQRNFNPQPSGFLSKMQLALGATDDLSKAVEAKKRGMSDVDSCNLLALQDNTTNMIDL